MDERSYRAASVVLGGDVAQSLAEAGWALVDALSVSAAMAGSDPAGESWARGYDRSAGAVLQATSDTITASFRLAALLEQTGFNYGAAESASVPGGTVGSGPDRTRWEWRECTLPAPESAGGAGVSSPWGWSLVADLVGYVWPNGHQDRLRRAAGAWRQFSSVLRSASYDVSRAFACLEAQDAPEAPDALLACRSVESQLHALAAQVSAVGDACAAYADQLDDAHSAVCDELVSLAEWTAGIEAGGALLSVVTLGGSEVAAQAAEASRLAATAARIASVLARFTAAARAGVAAIADVAFRAAAVGDELRPLLMSRIVVAVYVGAEPLRVASSAAMAEEKLVVAAEFERTAEGRKAIEYATTPAKLAHVFVPKHNLERLIEALGTREAVMRLLLSEIRGRVPVTGRFVATVDAIGQPVVVRGCVVDGVIRIGTAFTP